MGIACTLGLAACLNFAGQAIPAEDAQGVLDDCGLLQQLPASSFIQHSAASMTDVRSAAMSSMGAATGESIESAGVRLDWPNSGGMRKALWLRTCAQFEAAFSDPQNWSHLEKLPW